LGNTLDDRDNALPLRNEPSLDARRSAAPPDLPEVDDMPAWLKEPPPVPASGAGWKQTVALWGGSAVLLAVVFAGAMWLFEEHKADSALEVVAASASLPAQPVAQPAAPGPAPARATGLPPLVLLAPAPATPAAPPAAVAPVETATPAPPAAAVKPVEPVAPPIVKPAPRATPAKPAKSMKPAPAKAAPKALAEPARKPALAGPVAVAPKAKAKPAVKPKRVAAKPKLSGGVTLPPARERSGQDETEQAPPAPRKCQPGELARECAARNGAY
jgi:hypothetical protein